MQADDDESFELQNTQLDHAARDGDLQTCMIVLTKWKEDLQPAKLTSKHLQSAFAAAVGARHIDTVAFLLENGAAVSSSAMVLALGGDTQGTIAMFQIFLDHGWDINSKTDLGNPMLKHSSAKQNITL